MGRFNKRDVGYNVCNQLWQRFDKREAGNVLSKDLVSVKRVGGAFCMLEMRFRSMRFMNMILTTVRNSFNYILISKAIIIYNEKY